MATTHIIFLILMCTFPHVSTHSKQFHLLRSVLSSSMDSMRREQKDLKVQILAEVNSRIVPHIRQVLLREILTEVRREINSASRARPAAPVKVDVSRGVKQEIQREVQEMLEGPLKMSLKDELMRSVREQIQTEIQSGLAGFLRGSLKEELSQQIRRQISEEVQSRMVGYLKDSLREDVIKQLEKGGPLKVQAKLTPYQRRILKQSIMKEVKVEMNKEQKRRDVDGVRKEDIMREVRKEVNRVHQSSPQTIRKDDIMRDIRKEIVKTDVQRMLKDGILKDVKKEIHKIHKNMDMATVDKWTNDRKVKQYVDKVTGKVLANSNKLRSDYSSLTKRVHQLEMKHQNNNKRPAHHKRITRLEKATPAPLPRKEPPSGKHDSASKIPVQHRKITHLQKATPAPIPRRELPSSKRDFSGNRHVHHRKITRLQMATSAPPFRREPPSGKHDSSNKRPVHHRKITRFGQATPSPTPSRQPPSGTRHPSYKRPVLHRKITRLAKVTPSPVPIPEPPSGTHRQTINVHSQLQGQKEIPTAHHSVTNSKLRKQPDDEDIYISSRSKTRANLPDRDSLLIAKQNHSEAYFAELSSGTISILSSSLGRYVGDLSYDVISKTLYWSDWKVDAVYSYSVAEQEQIIIKPNILSYGIEVDTRGRVLICSDYWSRSIYTMDLDMGGDSSRSMNQITRITQGNPMRIALDASSKRIYVSVSYTKIIQVNYDNGKTKTIVEIQRGFINGLGLNPKTRILYFNNFTSLMAKNVTRRRQDPYRVSHSPGKEASDILVKDGDVYIAYYNSRSVEVIREGETTPVWFADLPGASDKHLRVSMCYVPAN